MTISWPLGVSALSMFLWFHMGETSRGQKIVVLSALYIKQIKYIHTNASKKIDDYRL